MQIYLIGTTHGKVEHNVFIKKCIKKSYRSKRIGVFLEGFVAENPYNNLLVKETFSEQASARIFGLESSWLYCLVNCMSFILNAVNSPLLKSSRETMLGQKHQMLLDLISNRDLKVAWEASSDRELKNKIAYELELQNWDPISFSEHIGNKTNILNDDTWPELVKDLVSNILLKIPTEFKEILNTELLHKVCGLEIDLSDNIVRYTINGEPDDEDIAPELMNYITTDISILLRNKTFADAIYLSTNKTPLDKAYVFVGYLHVDDLNEKLLKRYENFPEITIEKYNRFGDIDPGKH